MMLPASRPARAKLRDERLRRDQRALQMRVDHRVPCRFGVLLETPGLERGVGRRRSEAGVVHEDRRGAEPRADLGERRVDRGARGGVDDMRRDWRARIDQLGQQRLRPRGEIEQRDRRTGAGQRARVLRPEAAETSGDDGDAAIEAKWVGVARSQWNWDRLPPRHLQDRAYGSGKRERVRRFRGCSQGERTYVHELNEAHSACVSQRCQGKRLSKPSTRAQSSASSMLLPYGGGMTYAATRLP